jgi:GNAT superfamily N-acetyltransferase
MTIEIRKASTLDTTKLIAMATALMDEIGGVPGSKGQVSRLFAEIEHSDCDQVLVAKDDGAHVGMLLIHYRRAMSHGNWVAEVDDMYVDPGYRHKGVGAMLLEEASRQARRRGAEALVAGVGSRNNKALSFYMHHGFHEVGFALQRELG